MAGPLRSMTGYGRGEASLNGAALTTEVRCVNSRHLDLRVRLPRDLQGFEAEIRELAAPFFRRGQVDLIVRVPAEGAGAPQVEIDMAAARRYAEAAHELERELGLGERLQVSTLLALPGVARVFVAQQIAFELAMPEIEITGTGRIAHRQQESKRGLPKD